MGLSPDALLVAAREAFGERILESHAEHGDATMMIARDDALEIFAALRDRPDFAFDMLVDVTAVDFLGTNPRFEVVYHLNSLTRQHRLRVKIRAAGEDPWVHSLTSLWKSANWLERECWDLVGVRFVGHPDPRRILMYEEFVGHPLRKDYPVDKRQPLTPERDPIETAWKR